MARRAPHRRTRPAPFLHPPRRRDRPVLDRSRENRSQLVFTTARGRVAVFWQSARTRKQARPNVRTPTARAAGITELEIVVDAHEQYPYRFADQQVRDPYIRVQRHLEI